MAFCKNCGNPIPEGSKFCTSCGAAVGIAASPEPVPAQPEPVAAVADEPAPVQPVAQPVAQPVQPQYQQPQYVPAPPYKEEPISTGGYVGILLLMMIPLVNLVCLIIWACGGCSKRNKTNLSRAILIWMLIGVLLAGIIVLAGGLLFGDSLDALMELGSELGSM